MGSQQIFFEHGGPLTGDSDERGVDTAPDGGVESVKPVGDGERAVEANFNRPTENLRQRTEMLRQEAEGSKYLIDSNMRFMISAGNADGVGAGQPLPTVLTWNATTGKFTTANPLVVQPLNSPAGDERETKVYTFIWGPDLGDIQFRPLRALSPDDKFAYNGANLIRIKWVTADPATITIGNYPGAGIVTNYCAAIVTGDPDHILTITIRNDDLTTLDNVDAALALITALQLTPAGIEVVSTGGSVEIHYGLIPVDDRDYYLKGTADRELHYITPAVFATFFGGSSLADGDTLSIYFPELVETSGTDGRRQRIRSKSNTTVTAADLFITTAHPERIPYAIPLCKRIGDSLIWIDGTVIRGTQAGLPMGFGEHGDTLNRLDTLQTLVDSLYIRKIYPVGVPVDDYTLIWRSHNIASDLAVSKETSSWYLGKTGAVILLVGGYINNSNGKVYAGSGVGDVSAVYLAAGSTSFSKTGVRLLYKFLPVPTSSWNLSPATAWDKHFQIGSSNSYYGDTFYWQSPVDLEHRLTLSSSATTPGWIEANPGAIGSATEMHILFEGQYGATNFYYKVYVGGSVGVWGSLTDSFWIVINAYWDPVGKLWHKTLALQEAYALKVGSSGVTFLYTNAATDPWAYLTWTSMLDWASLAAYGSPEGAYGGAYNCFVGSGERYERFGFAHRIKNTQGANDTSTAIQHCAHAYRNKWEVTSLPTTKTVTTSVNSPIIPGTSIDMLPVIALTYGVGVIEPWGFVTQAVPNGVLNAGVYAYAYGFVDVYN